MEKVLLIGASTRPDRYAYIAFKLLKSYGHEATLLGLKEEEVDGVKFLTEFPSHEKFDTVTLYINPNIQKKYYHHLLELAPQRIIFNPGTENEELYHLLEEKNIYYIEACTLVMLRTGQY